jgi:hypothetical protein
MRESILALSTILSHDRDDKPEMSQPYKPWLTDSFCNRKVVASQRIPPTYEHKPMGHPSVSFDLPHCGWLRARFCSRGEETCIAADSPRTAQSCS